MQRVKPILYPSTEAEMEVLLAWLVCSLLNKNEARYAANGKALNFCMYCRSGALFRTWLKPQRTWGGD